MKILSGASVTQADLKAVEDKITQQEQLLDDRLTVIEENGGSVDLTPYAKTVDVKTTTDALDDRIDALEQAGIPDVADLVTKNAYNEKMTELDNADQDLDARIKTLENDPGVDMTAYLTKVETEAITDALDGRLETLESKPAVDLTGYAKTEDLETTVTNLTTMIENVEELIPDTSGFALATDMSAADSALASRVTTLEGATAPDLTIYAIKTEVADQDTALSNRISALESVTAPNLEPYALISYVDEQDSAINTKITNLETTMVTNDVLADYSTTAQAKAVTDLLDTRLTELEEATGPNLEGYATETYVDTADAVLSGRIEAIEDSFDPTSYAKGSDLTALTNRVTVLENNTDPETSSFATKDYVSEEIAKIDLGSYATESELTTVSAQLSAADSALDVRVKALEENPELPNMSDYALKTDLTTETSTRIADDSALDERLTALEEIGIPTDGTDGINGLSIEIQNGTYREPGSSKALPDLPAFSASEEGQVYIVANETTTGQLDWYYHAKDGTDWTKFLKWGGNKGSKGSSGVFVPDYTNHGSLNALNAGDTYTVTDSAGFVLVTPSAGVIVMVNGIEVGIDSVVVSVNTGDTVSVGSEAFSVTYIPPVAALLPGGSGADMSDYVTNEDLEPFADADTALSARITALESWKPDMSTYALVTDLTPLAKTADQKVITDALTAKIDALETAPGVDLSPYALVETVNDLETELNADIAAINAAGYQTLSDVEMITDALDIRVKALEDEEAEGPDLSAYTTKMYVDAADTALSDRITSLEASSGGEGVDLTDYAKKTYVTDITDPMDTRITTLEESPGPDLTGYATTEQQKLITDALDERIVSLEDVPAPDLTPYAKSEDVSAVTNDLDDRIDALESTTAPDLTPYAKTTEVATLTDALSSRLDTLEDVKMEDYLTKTDGALITDALDARLTAEETKSTDYATRISALESAPGADLSEYAKTADQLAITNALDLRIDALEDVDYSEFTTTEAQKSITDALDARISSVEGAYVSEEELQTAVTTIGETTNALDSRIVALEAGGGSGTPVDLSEYAKTADVETITDALTNRIVILEATPGMNMDNYATTDDVTAADTELSTRISAIEDRPIPVDGKDGLSMVIVTGIYREPGSTKNLPDLPDITTTDVGNAYLVDDDELAGQYDLYYHSPDAIDWMIIHKWGGVPGPSGMLIPDWSSISASLLADDKYPQAVTTLSYTFTDGPGFATGQIGTGTSLNAGLAGLQTMINGKVVATETDGRVTTGATEPTVFKFLYPVNKGDTITFTLTKNSRTFKECALYYVKPVGAFIQNSPFALQTDVTSTFNSLNGLVSNLDERVTTIEGSYATTDITDALDVRVTALENSSGSGGTSPDLSALDSRLDTIEADYVTSAILDPITEAIDDRLTALESNSPSGSGYDDSAIVARVKAIEDAPYTSKGYVDEEISGVTGTLTNINDSIATLNANVEEQGETISGLPTKKYVDDADTALSSRIAILEGADPDSPDLSGYVTQTELSQVTERVTIAETTLSTIYSNYVDVAYVKTETDKIDATVSGIQGSLEGVLADYATASGLAAEVTRSTQAETDLGARISEIEGGYVSSDSAEYVKMAADLKTIQDDYVINSQLSDVITAYDSADTTIKASLKAIADDYLTSASYNQLQTDFQAADTALATRIKAIEDDNATGTELANALTSLSETNVDQYAKIKAITDDYLTSASYNQLQTDFQASDTALDTKIKAISDDYVTNSVYQADVSFWDQRMTTDEAAIKAIKDDYVTGTIYNTDHSAMDTRVATAEGKIKNLEDNTVSSSVFTDYINATGSTLDSLDTKAHVTEIQTDLQTQINALSGADMSAYATDAEVKAITDPISEAVATKTTMSEVETVLEDYATTADQLVITNAISDRVGALEEVPAVDLTPYAKTTVTDALDTRLDTLEAVDTSAYATKAEEKTITDALDNRIEALESIDMTEYATATSVTAMDTAYKAADTDLSTRITTLEEVPAVDLTSYAKTTVTDALDTRVQVLENLELPNYDQFNNQFELLEEVDAGFETRLDTLETQVPLNTAAITKEISDRQTVVAQVEARVTALEDVPAVDLTPYAKAADLTAESVRATTAEANLGIRVSNAKPDSIAFDPTSHDVTIVFSDEDSIKTNIGLADEDTDGLMSSSVAALVAQMSSDVTSLKMGGVWRGTYATYADLTTAYPSLDVSGTDWFANDYVEIIDDESTTTGHTAGSASIWAVQTNADGTVKTLVFRRDESFTETQVTTATNAKVGVVKGNNVDYGVSVDASGNMSTVGIKAKVDTINTTLTTVGTSITTLQNNVAALQEAVSETTDVQVEKLSAPPSFADAETDILYSIANVGMDGTVYPTNIGYIKDDAQPNFGKILNLSKTAKGHDILPDLNSTAYISRNNVSTGLSSNGVTTKDITSTVNGYLKFRVMDRPVETDPAVNPSDLGVYTSWIFSLNGTVVNGMDQTLVLQTDNLIGEFFIKVAVGDVVTIKSIGYGLRSRTAYFDLYSVAATDNVNLVSEDETQTLIDDLTARVVTLENLVATLVAANSSTLAHNFA